MNIIDLAILGIIVVSVFFGMYYGFTVSLFNIFSYILSWFSSLIFYPLLTRSIIARVPEILERVIYYSEGSSKMAFADRMLPVSSLSPDRIAEIVRVSALPNPFNRSLGFNLANENLGGLSTTGQYFDHTVANVIINLISFILIFIAMQLLFMLVISLMKNIWDLPVLKKFDSFSAGALGLVRGVLFLFMIFAFIPLLYLVVPADFLAEFLEKSKLISFFVDANIFTLFIKGVF